MARFRTTRQATRFAPITNSSRRGFLPALENLEDRTLLSVAYPLALVDQPGALVPASVSGLPGGLSPAQVRHAYGFDQITFSNGAVKGNGAGQTIAIVDAYDQPNLASNLATFDATYGIAAPPSFTKVNENGGTALPAASASWGLEESLDVEWAHAIAPGAKIVLVEASSANFSDLLAAVNYARNLSGVSVVSMSWGGSEWSGETAYDSYFKTPAGHTGVTFIASSGDSGSAGSPESPSISPNVLAVGGTQLSTDGAGDYLGETAWSGSGGGISLYESQPSYQKGIVSQSATKRTVPDVSYDGSSGSPFAVYDTSAYAGWLEVYGTSAGAPQWAGLIAIADQGRALAGKTSLDGATQTLPAIYQLPSSDFHDIASGSNGSYSAAPGYDLVTGRGSPLANLVVSGLVGGTSSPPPVNHPPQLVTAAHASANPVSGNKTALSVLGSDTAGASSLTYTWTIVSDPSGIAAPTFSANGTNAAQNTTASFYGAGSYTFLVTLKDPAGLTVTSSVTVTVSQIQTYLAVMPGTVSVADGHSQQFTAVAEDQFGNKMSRQPTWSWSVVAGAGSISSTGVYTSPASGNGSSAIRLAGGGESVTALVNHFAAVPAAPTNLTATPVGSGWILLSWKNNSTNQTGVVIQRSTNGVTWSIVGAVGGNVSFFDVTAASKLTSYSYRVYAYNSAGVSGYSSMSASVRPAAVTFGRAAAALVSTPATVGGTSAAAVQQNAGLLEANFLSGAAWQQAADALAAYAASAQNYQAANGRSSASDAFWLS